MNPQVPLTHCAVVFRHWVFVTQSGTAIGAIVMSIQVSLTHIWLFSSQVTFTQRIPPASMQVTVIHAPIVVGSIGHTGGLVGVHIKRLHVPLTQTTRGPVHCALVLHGVPIP